MIKFNVLRGNPEEVHAGLFTGAFLRGRIAEPNDTAVVLRAVADEIDRLRTEHPNGRIGTGYDGSADLTSPDFAVSAVAGAMPRRVKQLPGEGNV